MSTEQIAAARRAADRGVYERAVTILRPLAEKGSAEAQFQLGRLVLTECELLSGREGFDWLHAAAVQGHSEAMYRVSVYPSFPREPFESPLSSETAWQFLLRAAAAGITEAQYDAAACLATGTFSDRHTIAKDLGAAVGWYRRASEAGHVEAQFNLAVMLLNGEGCTADRTEATRWLQEAASHGDTQAPVLLAELDREA